MMNRKTMALIRKMADLDGQFLWQSGLSAGQPGTLLGHPPSDRPARAGDWQSALAEVLGGVNVLPEACRGDFEE